MKLVKLKRIIGRNKEIYIYDKEIEKYEEYTIAHIICTRTTLCYKCKKAISVGEIMKVKLLLNKDDIKNGNEIIKAYIGYTHYFCDKNE